MPIYKREGSDVWYVDIRRPGHGRLRRSSGERDREAAQREYDEIAAGLWHEKRGDWPIEDALAAWVKARPRTVHELSSVKQMLAAFPRLPLSMATEAAFMNAFGDKTPPTYNRIANIYRAALKIAVRAGWLVAVPEIKRRKEQRRDPRYLTGEEWERLRAELPEHLQPMAEFAVATGLRLANVAMLTWDRVDLKRKIAWVPAGAAKGRKALSVPLSATALAALRAIRGERTGFVFTYDGEPLRSPKTAFLKARKRAGLDGFRWHDFRHTWASWHIQRGTPLAVLQELGGWSTPDMVRRYAHLAPSHIAGFADNARPLPAQKSKRSKAA